MDNFCLEALQHLSKMETARQTEPLSIDSLARVDISLVRCPDGSLNYYVNEMSRGLACGLMKHLAGQRTKMQVMASSVRNGLIRSYTHHCTQYPWIPRRHIVLEQLFTSIQTFTLSALNLMVVGRSNNFFWVRIVTCNVT
jgi:hypothetical protein